MSFYRIKTETGYKVIPTPSYKRKKLRKYEGRVIGVYGYYVRNSANSILLKCVKKSGSNKYLVDHIWVKKYNEKGVNVMPKDRRPYSKMFILGKVYKYGDVHSGYNYSITPIQVNMLM